MINSNDCNRAENKTDMRGHLGDLGADLISLSELQIELLTVDTRDAVRESFYPMILLFLGGGLVMGACPVLLTGISWWLSTVSDLSLAASFFTVALCGLLIATALFFFAWKGLGKSLGLLKRSRTELKSNIQWIKKILSEKHHYRSSRS
ncbi:hypothetical protein Enr17x_17910 [Gimesia fumaroli]|uniref:Uncharacterized protein n=2 Tax=Gimesia fumaroli TaxID=2527976 RepID=A0A518I9J9_9PLAN|nr:hypothetical protein Enr17x_17910 [Gimesia fumaroli]